MSEMSKPIFWRKNEKNTNLSFAEFSHRKVMVRWRTPAFFFFSKIIESMEAALKSSWV